MSGPKYSEAELKKMEKERLERERIEKIQRQKRELEDAKNKYLEEINSFLKFKKELLIYCRTNNDKLFETEIKESKKIVEEFNITNPSTKEELLKATQELVSMREEQKKRLNKAIENSSEREKLRIIDHIATQNRINIFEDSMIEIDELEPYRELIQEANNIVEVFDEDKKNISKLTKKLEELINGKKVDVHSANQLADIIRYQIEDISNKYKDYSKAYEEYIVKAEYVCEEIKRIDSFTSIDEIEAECNRLDNLGNEKDKLEYISSSIKEVMDKYGHNIIRNDVFSISGQSYQRDVYHYSKDSVLRFTQNKKGAMVIDVAYISDKEKLSEVEKQIAVNNMQSFCKQYPEILKELDEKGIVFKKKVNIPPNDSCIVLEKNSTKENIENPKVKKKRELKNASV